MAARACARSFLPAADFSFSYRERLHTARQFQRVFDRANRSGSKAFVLLSRENTVGYPRLGMVVAKRKARRAVDRNMVKRMIRESFRTHKAGLPASDYVVILKQPAGPAQRDILRKQLTGLWTRCTQS
ncbi:MAG: ribonuclease P protein component [Gammaproteobacteria bacterium]|nr:ribonuclease P protein component [Gammaproteobacteria bacterium]MDE0411944.1 ribonuclease P protein component [Gammaproteobacteria bacterium]